MAVDTCAKRRVWRGIGINSRIPGTNCGNRWPWELLEGCWRRLEEAKAVRGVPFDGRKGCNGILKRWRGIWMRYQVR